MAEGGGPLDYPVDHLIGTWRRFGSAGPVYEVLSQVPSEGRRKMRVRLVESGEELDYSLADLLDDPRER
jgi:hypothetical protein